jgi:putative transposase
MRKPRNLVEGSSYHVTVRANRKEMILDARSMKEMLLAVVRTAKGKYEFRLENFCIMGNHVHFIITPGRGVSLSAVMQWILGVFAMRFNRKLGTTGHVWGGRFFSRIIASFQDLVQVHRYIDDNPVMNELVDDRREWIWGGLYHNRTGRREIVEELEPSLRRFLPGHEGISLA